MRRRSAGALLAALVVLAACSSESVEPSAPSTTATSVTMSTTSSEEATTTLATEGSSIVTSDAPTTTVPAPATSEAAEGEGASSTTEAGGFGGGAPTTAAGDGLSSGVPARTTPSLFTIGSAEGDPEVSAAVGACEPFYEGIGGGTYSVARCGVWNAIGGQRVWTVTKGAVATSRFMVIVWQQSSPGSWRPVLRATEDEIGQWADATLRTGNLDEGPNDELVAGIRMAGTGGYLNLEIIDIRRGNPLVVAVSPVGDRAVAVMVPGTGVDVWRAVYEDSDPLCCPSTYQLFVLLSSSTGWIVDERVGVPTGDPLIPISQF